jgi:hypothetical protein
MRSDEDSNQRMKCKKTPGPYGIYDLFGTKSFPLEYDPVFAGDCATIMLKLVIQSCSIAGAERRN